MKWLAFVCMVGLMTVVALLGGCSTAQEAQDLALAQQALRDVGCFDKVAGPIVGIVTGPSGLPAVAVLDALGNVLCTAQAPVASPVGTILSQ
jgi:hypothetical protein